MAGAGRAEGGRVRRNRAGAKRRWGGVGKGGGVTEGRGEWGRRNKALAKGAEGRKRGKK